MVFTGPGAREGGWGETRAPSLIFPTPSVRAVSLCLKGGVPLVTELPTTVILGNHIRRRPGSVRKEDPGFVTLACMFL